MRQQQLRIPSLSVWLCCGLLCCAGNPARAGADENVERLKTSLESAGKNRVQIQKALDDVPAAERAGMQFLVANMPDRDLRELTAEFLLDNVRLAYKAWNESPWKNDVPQEIFFNDVLPYASINERRDSWRKEFYEKFSPLIKDAKTPAEAAGLLNQKVFPLVNVHYSTKRPKADQSPQESIKAGLASCTGLSVLLIDACRSVGVPARFVGVIWADNSGNHSWTEVWDHGWHFTGAAEPAGGKLDQAWFASKAGTAVRDEPLHAIYATSYRRTPLKFLFAWDPNIDYVYAFNVTDRYAAGKVDPPEGTVPAQFRVLDGKSGDRCPASLKITDAAGRTVFEGTTKDERFDANDHLSMYLLPGQEYQVEIRHAAHELKTNFKCERRDTPYTWKLEPSGEKK